MQTLISSHPFFSILCDNDHKSGVTDWYLLQLLDRVCMDFHEMYEQYAPKVHRFALFLSGDATLADDITSETFYRAWTSTAPIQQATVQSYLFTIAKNYYRDVQRREKRSVPIGEHILDPTISVEKRAQASSDLKKLLAGLKTLSELDRAAPLLRSQQEMSL